MIRLPSQGVLGPKDPCRDAERKAGRKGFSYIYGGTNSDPGGIIRGIKLLLETSQKDPKWSCLC